MIYLIDKQTLLEEAIHRHIYNSSSNSNNNSEQNIKNTEKLFNELNIFLKKYNIPKDQIIIFGSAVLGLKGLRTPNDLDIGITENGISTIKKYYSPAKGSYGAQYDIGNLSFIHELTIPKFKGQSLFNQKVDKYKGVNIISFEQWKEMQKHDPLQKDKKFITESSLMGPSQEWKDNHSKKVISPITIQHNITVYGENHFKPDEVHFIRAQIIKNKPDIIVHEIPEDASFYKQHLPNTKFYQLERGLDKNIYKYFKDDLVSQFKHREENMLRNIDFARSGGLYNNGSKNITVVVGDTHLRTIETPELGKASPFHNRGFNIIRSKYSEIK